MKKTGFLALVLAAGMTLPLAACGGEKGKIKVNGAKFDVADYAAAIENTSERPAPKSVTLIDGTLSNFGSPYLLECVPQPNSDAHSLYDVTKGEFCTLKRSNYIDFIYYNGLIEAITEDQSYNDTYDLYSPTGVRIASNVTSFDRETRTFSEKNINYTYYKITYTTSTEYGNWEYYGSLAVGKDDVTWEEIDEETYTGEDGAGGTLGDVLTEEKYPLCDLDDYPDYAMDDITYTVRGSLAHMLTFYRGESKLSEVTLPATVSWEDLLFIGNHLFFLDIKTVPQNADKGYNVEILADALPIKMSVKLCSFDFVKGGKIQEIDTPFAVLNMQPLYNTKENIFDKFLVNAASYTNGIASVRTEAFDLRLVLDEKGKVSKDLTAANFDFESPIYRLAPDRYLAGNTIMNGDFEPVAFLPGSNPTCYPEARFIVSRTSGSSLTVCDYNGKLLFPQIDASYMNWFVTSGSLVTVNGYAENQSAYTVYNRDQPFGRYDDGDRFKGENPQYACMGYNFYAVYFIPENGTRHCEFMQYTRETIDDLEDFIPQNGAAQRAGNISYLTGTIDNKPKTAIIK